RADLGRGSTRRRSGAGVSRRRGAPPRRVDRRRHDPDPRQERSRLVAVVSYVARREGRCVLRQDSPVRRRDSGADGRELPRVCDDARGRARRRRRDAARPHRHDDLLRLALPGAIPPPRRARRGRDRRACRVHGADGSRALASVADGPCDRVARVRRRRRAMGRACRRTQDVRAFDDRRSVGRGARGAAGGRWYRRGRTRYDRIGTPSPTVPGARASARALTMIQPQQLVAPSLAGAVLSTDPLSVVERQLLEPAGLELADVDRALGELMAHRLDYGDLYFQSTRYESWSVEDGNVKEGVFSVDQGVGVRAIVGEKTGFAYADQLDVASLLDAAAAARGIARSGGEG